MKKNELVYLLLIMLIISIAGVMSFRNSATLPPMPFYDPDGILTIQEQRILSGSVDYFNLKFNKKVYALMVKNSPEHSTNLKINEAFERWQPDLLLVVNENSKEIQFRVGKKGEKIFTPELLAKAKYEAQMYLDQREWQQVTKAIFKVLSDASETARSE